MSVSDPLDLRPFQPLLQASLGTVLNSIGDAVLVTDAQGRVTLLNPVAEQLTGWTTAEAIEQESKTVFDILNEKTRQVVESPIGRVIREGVAVGLANYTILRRRDGTEISIDDSAAPVRDADSNLVGVVLVFRDISERRVAEEALREREEYLRRLLESSPDCIKTLDLEGHLLSMNEGGQQVLQIDDFSKVCGADWLSFWQDEDTRRDLNAALDVARRGERGRFHGFCPTFKGEPRWWDVVVVPLFGVDGNPEQILGVSRDVTENRLAEERLRLATESANIGTWDLNPITATLFWDSGCRAAFGYPLDRPVDYATFLSLIHPDDRARTDAAVQAALVPNGTGEYAVEFRTIGYLDYVERWVRAQGRALFDESRTRAVRFVGTILDVSEMRYSEQALQEAQARLDTAILAGNIATWTWDLVNDRVFADANLARLFSVDPQEAAGGRLDVYINAIHPEDRGRVIQIIDDAATNGDTYEAEYRVVLPEGENRWLVARGTVTRDAQGKAIQLPGVVLDITERVQRERREYLLVEIAQRTYGLTDPQAVVTRVVEMVGNFLQVDRCLFAQIDMKADLAIIHDEYRAHETVPPLIGTLPFSAFGAFVVSECEVGRAVAVDDVRNDPVRVPPATLDAYLSIGVTAHVAVPAIYGGALVGVLAVHSSVARRWRTEDVELLRTIVERMWLTVENARLNRETQLRTDRESLLNQVGAAVRATLDPEEILRSAVLLLGQGLHADRCYFVRVDPVRHSSRVSPEWYREDAGLEPLAGRVFSNAAYATHDDPGYSLGRTHVMNDADDYGVEEATSFRTVQIRSRLRVPIRIDGETASLSVAMGYAARIWTEEEIRLVENVASLVRSALESAQAQQRERNIAEQLQAALTPPPPEGLPGLSLASLYRPALQEAGVGGDFFDVFHVEEGCTALIVGDLSGKGLRAASEVAIVRNMLRYALYSNRDVADAVTGLHRVLTKNELLSGFTTLFVSLYDHKEGTLTYVNCGQESGLIWRASTMEIEMLPATGPVLGGFGMTAIYEKEIVSLRTGDVLAVFTDGVTDVGPSRRNLLDLSGVSRLFRGCCINAARLGSDIDPQAVKGCLIAGVDAYAQGGARDDIALLIGVVTAGR